MTRDLRDLEENPAFRAWQRQNEREKAQELQERLNTEVPDNRYLQNSALWKAGQVQNHEATLGHSNTNPKGVVKGKGQPY